VKRCNKERSESLSCPRLCPRLRGTSGRSQPPYLTKLRRAGVCTGLMETPLIGRNNLTPTSTHTPADGHIVGVGGFVVPKDAAEFFARYPEALSTFVSRRAPNATGEERNALVLKIEQFLQGASPLIDCPDRIAMYALVPAPCYPQTDSSHTLRIVSRVQGSFAFRHHGPKSSGLVSRGRGQYSREARGLSRGTLAGNLSRLLEAVMKLEPS
jgi:hypothetical protein